MYIYTYKKYIFIYLNIYMYAFNLTSNINNTFYEHNMKYVCCKSRVLFLQVAPPALAPSLICFGNRMEIISICKNVHWPYTEI